MIFFSWFRKFERFASSHKQVRDILWKGLHMGTGKIFTLSVMMFIFFWSDESNPIFFTFSVIIFSSLSFYDSHIFWKRRLNSYIYSSKLSWVNSDVMIPSVCIIFVCLLTVKHETHTPPPSHPAPAPTTAPMSLFMMEQIKFKLELYTLRGSLRIGVRTFSSFES